MAQNSGYQKKKKKKGYCGNEKKILGHPTTTRAKRRAGQHRNKRQGASNLEQATQDTFKKQTGIKDAGPAADFGLERELDAKKKKSNCNFPILKLN